MKHDFFSEPFSYNDLRGGSGYGAIEAQFISAKDGCRLAYYREKPKGKPRAAMAFLHGAGAHCALSDYQSIGGLLGNEGIDSYFIDLRGHGRSDGPRGDCPKPQSAWEDIRAFIEYIKKDNADLPIVLAGHSAGAGMMINYATWKGRVECDAYIAVAPYLGYKAKSSRFSPLQDRFAFPDMKTIVINKLSLGLAYRHKQAVFYNYSALKIKRDPLIIRSISCAFSAACTLWNPRKEFESIQRPMGVFIGSGDELFDPERVRAYFEMLDGKVKDQSKFQILPGQKHITILTAIDRPILEYIESVIA